MTSPDYDAVVQHYAQTGGALQAAGKVVSTAEKAALVAADAGVGAGIGAAIPVLGELGIGEAAGALVAGVYGAFDQFGGDIMNFLNPPDFSEGQYDAMRRKCIASGGLPNPGHAPDNAEGCIYPDGTTSGGDYPRHPPPGLHSIRGDSPPPALPPGLCPGPFGFPVPCPPPAAPPPPKPVIHVSKVRSRLKVPMPAPKPAPMPTVAKKPVMHVSLIAHRQLAAAHALVAAVKAGDPGAQSFVDGVVAKSNAGDPQAQVIHAALTQAQKLQIRAKYIQKWVYGAR